MAVVTGRRTAGFRTAGASEPAEVFPRFDSARIRVLLEVFKDCPSLNVGKSECPKTVQGKSAWRSGSIGAGDSCRFGRCDGLVKGRCRRLDPCSS
jgi:hypothetical protein